MPFFRFSDAGSDDVAVAAGPAVVATTEGGHSFVDRWLAETVHAGSAAIEDGGGCRCDIRTDVCIDVRTDTQLSHRGWHKKGTSDDGHERTGSIPDLHGADVG